MALRSRSASWAGCIEYYSHIFYFDMEVGTEGIHDLWQDGREVWANGRYFTELVTERAGGVRRNCAIDISRA